MRTSMETMFRTWMIWQKLKNSPTILCWIRTNIAQPSNTVFRTKPNKIIHNYGNRLQSSRFQLFYICSNIKYIYINNAQCFHDFIFINISKQWYISKAAIVDCASVDFFSEFLHVLIKFRQWLIITFMIYQIIVIWTSVNAMHIFGHFLDFLYNSMCCTIDSFKSRWDFWMTLFEYHKQRVSLVRLHAFKVANFCAKLHYLALRAFSWKWAINEDSSAQFIHLKDRCLRSFEMD